MNFQKRYLGALDATSGKLLLVAARAVDVLLTRDERLGSDRSLADEAGETLLVPLTALVLHFLGAYQAKNNRKIKTRVKNSPSSYSGQPAGWLSGSP